MIKNNPFPITTFNFIHFKFSNQKEIISKFLGLQPLDKVNESRETALGF